MLRLVVTGGGTGGHVYPALEVARYASEQGAEILYLGSLRGQEGKACADRGILFQGFPSEPLYSLKTPRGWRAASQLLRAKSMAKRALKAADPDVVFSTGGYSAGPVVAAARSLGIPYCIHEANSVPGRSNLMFAHEADAFTCLFKSTPKFAPNVSCVRVGQPLRHELREAVKDRNPADDLVLIVGGSQGSEYLNMNMPRAATSDQLQSTRFLHASGPKNFESTFKVVQSLGIDDRYRVVPYLETNDMVEAYRSATVVVGRSGSTLAELAMFGIPSVLVPLPSAAGNHQFHNAEEFVEINAAKLIPQDQATPAALAEAIEGWVGNAEARQIAERELKAWDIPDATERIYELIQQATVQH